MPTLILRPDSNGSENEVYQYPDSGSHYDKVDEEVSDGDATYLYYDTSLSGPKDEYFFYPDSGLGSATVNSVTVYAKVKKDSTGYGLFRLIVKVNSQHYESETKYATASYADISETWTTNPYTGQPWTVDEVDALEAGVRFNGVGNGCLWSRVTQVWVVVDYTSGVVTYTKTWTTDALFKRFDILKSFALDARFGALMTQTISRQIDVLLKRVDATKTFGLDAYFGPAEAETYMRDFALDVIFAYKVRLPELWLDENGKLVLNISKPYTWVGT